MAGRAVAAVLSAWCLWSCAGSKASRADRLVSEADVHLHQAGRYLRSLEPERAESELERARELLANPKLQEHPEASLLQGRFDETWAQLPEAKKKRDEREQRLQVERQRQELERARTRLLHALERLDAPSVERRDVSEVKAAVEQVLERAEEGRALEAKDVTYRDDAAHAVRGVERAKGAVAVAVTKLDFIEGPVATLVKGQALLGEAQKEPLLDAQLVRLQEARTALLACRDEGARMLQKDPSLAKLSVRGPNPGTTVLPAAVVDGCKGQLKVAEKLAASAQRKLDRQRQLEAKKAKAAAKKK